MAILDLIAEARNFIAGKDLPELDTILASLRNESSSLIDAKKDVDSESKSRKIEIRELRAKLEDNDIDSESSKTKRNELTAERDQLKAIADKWTTHEAGIHTHNREKWTEQAKRFQVEETDPNFEKLQKIKNDFAFGEDLTDAQIEKNINTYSIFDKAEYFKESSKSTNFNNQNPLSVVQAKKKYGFK